MEEKCCCGNKNCLTCYAGSLLKSSKFLKTQADKLDWLKSEKAIRHSLFDQLKLSIKIIKRIEYIKKQIDRAQFYIDAMEAEAAINEEKFLQRKELIEFRDNYSDEIEGVIVDDPKAILAKINKRMRFSEIEKERVELIKNN